MLFDKLLSCLPNIGSAQMHILSDYNAVYNYSIVLTACQYIWQNFFDFFKILLISYKNMIYRQKRKNLPFGEVCQTSQATDDGRGFTKYRIFQINYH